MQTMGVMARKTCTVLLAPLCIMLANMACGKEMESAKTSSVQAAKQATTSSSQATERTVADTDQQTTTTASDRPSSSEQNTEASVPEEKMQTTVDVYLFHGSYRCHSCNLMEEMTIEAIDEKLSVEKNQGTVVFHHVNVEEDQHRHFIQDYNIASISVILSQKSSGKEKKWKNLQEVWMRLRNRDAFKEYVVKEIKALL